MTCARCNDSGHLLQANGRHSEFLDCHYCPVASNLAAAERERRILSGIVMRADSLYPTYKIPTKEQGHA